MKIFVPLMFMAVSTCVALRHETWIDVGSLNKRYNFAYVKVSWDAALTACLKKGPGVRLATFSTPLETELVREYLGTAHEPIWIGLKRNESGSFSRVLAPQSDYYNWGHGKPSPYVAGERLLGSGDESCVEVLPKEEMTWKNMNCNTRQKFICEVDKVVYECGTEYKDWKYYDDYCYSIVETHEEAQDWQTAEEQCAQKNGHLASVHSENELNFFYDKLLSENATMHQMWLGSKHEKGVSHNWTDGSFQEVVKLHGSSRDKEGCLFFNFVYKRWGVHQCNRKLGFICKISLNLTKTLESSDETDGTGYVSAALAKRHLTGGRMAGVVINILLSLLILSVLIFMLVRWRRIYQDVAKHSNKFFGTKCKEETNYETSYDRAGCVDPSYE